MTRLVSLQGPDIALGIFFAFFFLRSPKACCHCLKVKSYPSNCRLHIATHARDIATSVTGFSEARQIHVRYTVYMWYVPDVCVCVFLGMGVGALGMSATVLCQHLIRQPLVSIFSGPSVCNIEEESWYAKVPWRKHVPIANCYIDHATTQPVRCAAHLGLLASSDQGKSQ